MKLAFIIIPHEGPTGIKPWVKPLTYLINRTINKFMMDFGGCTFYQVYGQWKGDGKQIKSTKIEVAVPDKKLSAFLEWADEVVEVAGVEEIMVQLPGGDIKFIKRAN